jgi:superfamily II DNA or RNA helicase
MADKDVRQNFIDPRAVHAVASVKTLLSKKHKDSAEWAGFGLVVIDEGHHVLEGNEWGRAMALFPNARGLFVTATPCRADGRGLGRHADGLVDEMVVGLQMRDAIDDGWLLDYRIYCPQGDYHRPDSADDIGASGDIKRDANRKAIKSSHIVGNAVEQYRRIIPGKKAVLYAPDIETASESAAEFNRAGIPAELVQATTPTTLRIEIMRRFRRGEVLVLCNVDLFGEGTDIPNMDAVIMLRATESFALYSQQFNRASTIDIDGPVPEDKAARLAAIAASDKPRAIIIDHVGNVVRFNGPPDSAHHRRWTLDAREKRSRVKTDDDIPWRACLNPTCMQVYERFHAVCPFCGDKPVPAERTAAEFVDGDLFELDAETLARMRGDVEKVDMPASEYREQLAANHCAPAHQSAHVKKHLNRQDHQAALRVSIAWWAAGHRDLGRGDREIYRRFFFAFGVDALAAKSLGTADADALADKINSRLISGVD